ncbi:MAG: choice-of-anchor I family protein, partial [Bacteroidetes bacterium]|nr:choice-of-anchor I family protein [Bacteroidota bacterium]
PSDDYKTDPIGSVSVIDLNAGVANATVAHATFDGVTIPSNVRVFGRYENTATDLFFSEYAEGSSNNKYLEIYNGTGSDVSLDNYAFPNTSNAPNNAGEYEYWNAFPSGDKIKAGETYIIAHPSADATILAKANHTMSFLSNGDDGFCLVKGGTWNDANSNSSIDEGEMTGFTILDCVGDWLGDPGNGWDVAGTTEGTKDHTLVRKGSSTGNSNWTAAAGTNPENSEWVVKDNEDWTNLGQHDFHVYSTPEQDLEPEYVAVSTDNKTAYVSLQENNAIAVVDIATAKVTKIIALGFKDLSLAKYALDVSDKDDSIGNQRNFDHLFGMFMPDAIAIANIGGTDYILTANEGDSRDYDGYSEEERVKDLKLDPTVFPNASTLQKDANLGRLKTTSSMGDTDGDGDYDEIYAYGGRSFTIWDTDGNMIFDSENQFERILADQFPGNYPDGRDDDKGAEPESVTVGKIGSKVFAFIGLERAAGVMVYDITDPANSQFVQYYNKNGNDQSPEGLIFVDGSKSNDGYAYLISTNETVDDYHGSVSAYRVNGLDGKKWVEVNNTDIDKMLNFYSEAVNLGATMFNRLEWVTYDEKTGAVYFTETGRDNPGGSWKDDHARGGVHAKHTMDRAAAQGTTPDAADYWDYYGRVLKFDPTTEEVTVHIEGGPHFATSPELKDYPANHLSNPDGLHAVTINGNSYLIILEDLNGSSAGRVPAGVSNRACEMYLLDLSIAKPTTADLVRVGVGPLGSEVTGACATPDGKTIFVNCQHPSTSNPFPYNYSLTVAMNGWDLDKLGSVHRMKRLNEQFVFSPNPTTGVVTFEKTQDVAVYDVNGVLVEVFEKANQINLSNYAGGVYFLRNEEGATKRLVLNR